MSEEFRERFFPSFFFVWNKKLHNAKTSSEKARRAQQSISFFPQLVAGPSWHLIS